MYMYMCIYIYIYMHIHIAYRLSKQRSFSSFLSMSTTISDLPSPDVQMPT